MTHARRHSAVAALLAALVVSGCSAPEQPPAEEESAAGARGSAAYTGLAEVPARLEGDGTTIVAGDPAAETTVRVLEDPRCPVVEEFEATGATALRTRTLNRATAVRYTFASFKDQRLGGDGSKRAVNALRAALEAGHFAEYHALLFARQTRIEAAGGFTTTALLKLADDVPGLRGAAFDSAVRTMKYQSFVTASQKAYDADDGPAPLGPGTPTVYLNGNMIEDDSDAWPWVFDQRLFGELLDSPPMAPDDL
ncbi:DsbA family protein [Streptomyces sp. NPDC050504]|uniref:DsbA family protein n=1 Tax=Streptomyces sp. NPDC050504 TaxID=3365618 RepID=UPI0037A02B7F